ncbi:MAG TPA: hypothetical protein VJU59_43680 [Paraburkholderia sp.]|uniref:hypothetical protein n=1 Tax=Paraburkholderia sp. TaxID=1926495 RepID=UPI002B4AA753|nr:hypothetical protein [Paraburkholderia sp.]HKR46495.1 hypothetical protein [Paraburkholderia sp.]
MELWIQPCVPCADLYGQPSTVDPHDKLSLIVAGAVRNAQVEQHYTCTRCGAAFARILKGEPRKQVWMLLNAGQH